MGREGKEIKEGKEKRKKRGKKEEKGENKAQKEAKNAKRRRKRSPAGPGGPSELETLEFWDEEIPAGSAHPGPSKIRQQRPGGREFPPSGSFPIFPARAGTGQRRRKGKKSLYWEKRGFFGR